MSEGHQHHFDPSGYESSVRDNVPDYETLQRTVTEAASERPASRVIDLGTGTGETLRRVAAAHPEATVIGFDAAEDMLAVARDNLPANAELRVGRLQDGLPDGPFDVAVSVLAIHHLDDREKQTLFRAICDQLAAGGRFVIGDLVEPDDPADIVTTRNVGFDKPNSAAIQLDWLRAAGFDVELRWLHRDLFVAVADKPNRV